MRGGVGARRDASTWRREVLRLAELAAEAAPTGSCAAAARRARFRSAFGDRWRSWCRGFGRPAARSQDQARVVTPSEAAAAGARYVVVGRMVTGSTGPPPAMQAVGLELGCLALAEDGDAERAGVGEDLGWARLRVPPLD